MYGMISQIHGLLQIVFEGGPLWISGRESLSLAAVVENRAGSGTFRTGRVICENIQMHRIQRAGYISVCSECSGTLLCAVCEGYGWRYTALEQMGTGSVPGVSLFGYPFFSVRRSRGTRKAALTEPLGQAGRADKQGVFWSGTECCGAF